MIFNKYLVIFIFAIIILTLYLYNSDTKENWQKKRKKLGLARQDDNNAPVFYNRCPFNKKFYMWDCLRLLFSTIIISGIIFLVYYCQNPTMTFSSGLDVVRAVISIAFMYALVIGIPVTNDNSLTEEQSSQTKNILKIIIFLKRKSIDSLVYKEDKYLKMQIKNKVKQWYEKNNKELGCLIIKIGNDFLKRRIPEQCENNQLEELQDMSLHIVKLFVDENPVLIDNIQLFFDKTVQDCGIALIDIVEFMNNVLLSAKNMSGETVDKHITDLLYSKNVSVKKENLGALKKRIFTLDESEIACMQVCQKIEDPISFLSNCTKKEYVQKSSLLQETLTGDNH